MFRPLFGGAHQILVRTFVAGTWARNTVPRWDPLCDEDLDWVFTVLAAATRRTSYTVCFPTCVETHRCSIFSPSPFLCQRSFPVLQQRFARIALVVHLCRHRIDFLYITHIEEACSFAKTLSHPFHYLSEGFQQAGQPTLAFVSSLVLVTRTSFLHMSVAHTVMCASMLLEAPRSPGWRTFLMRFEHSVDEPRLAPLAPDQAGFLWLFQSFVAEVPIPFFIHQ